MSRPPASREEFLDWSEREGGSWEFDGRRAVPTPGSSIRHDRLVRRLRGELERALDGKRFEAFGSGVGVMVPGGGVRFADAVVTGLPAVDDRARTVPEPVVVFEVASTASTLNDRIVKLREYAAVPSIRRYVIVDAEELGISVFHRNAPGTPFFVDGRIEGELVALPEVGAELSVDALYHGILSPPVPDGSR